TSNETTNFSNNIIKDGLPVLERGEITTEGNITEDPLFVNPENNDFRLQLNSLGINAGVNSVVNGDSDILSNPRIYNETVDIGAFEYGLYFDINDVVVAEGDEGTREAEFAVTLLDTLGQPATEQIEVDYTTRDGRATAGEDYTADSGTLIFATGDTELNTGVIVAGDTLPEDNETFFVSLSDATGNAVIRDSQGVGLITNDDLDQAGDSVFRLLNPDIGVHFYTTDVAERDEFIASGNYESEGASFTSVNPDIESSEEVFRFFNETTGVHLYTTDENERDFIRDNLSDFAFEGAVFNAYETEVEKSIPVYRFFNPSVGVHFYTPNAAERDFVAENLSNYESEGIAYYALPLEE
ncbi:MAG: Calx-beta domain-containing protein, partial [Cyanobacteria bacterium P01_A01_bin.83]